MNRALVIGSVAGVAAVLIGGVAFAATKKGKGPSAPTKWRPATAADVSRDGTEPVYVKLLNTQPVGFSTTGVFNGNTWRFDVCSGANCQPPSSFQKDVRGFIGTA